MTDSSFSEQPAAHVDIASPPLAESFIRRTESARRYLSQHLTLYRQASERLSVKQRLLIEGDAARMDAVDAELQAIGEEIERVERDRCAHMTQMGEDPHQPLSESFAQLPPEQARPLQQMRRELIREIETVQMRQEQTQSLLQASIEWIGGVVALMAQKLVPEGGAYNQQGRRRALPPDVGQASTIRRDI